MLISIHTPTQGVTVVSTTLRDYYKISIHTPTQGVTGMVGYIQSLQLISIHTPTQGVTYDRWTIIKPVEDFNPHSHAGSDKILGLSDLLAQIFQSTLPRRE